MATRKRKPSARQRPAPRLQSFETLLINAGLKPGSFIRLLKEDLARTADPVRAANNLHRFLASGFPTTILNDFRAHRVLQQIALELFSQSQYLADVLVRDTELFRWLTTTAALKLAKPKSEFLDGALSSVNLFSRMDRKLDSLRRYHRREILRIGAREILREADIITITRELSDLADSVVEAVVQLARQELAVRTGTTFKNTFVVIGLGKLGGQELNFSSDIDLLCLYDEDGEFDAPQERIRTFHEYYNRLAEFVVRKLTEFSGEGHLYRVDMRLRPEGSSGPLAISRAGSLQYYEVRGEPWERQMLVKARPVAGNSEVGMEWLEAVRPFVYPRTFVRSPLEEIAAMKSRIEERVTAESNIKLGEGGIRDVEFVVQGLQLLNGGGDERLRETNTLKSLELLTESGKLPQKDSRTLSEAYKFFRTVEHRLQLLHGSQTHSLPATKTEAEFLARRLSFPGARVLGKTVDEYRRSVRRIFNKILLKPGSKRTATSGMPPDKLVLRIIDKETHVRNLERLGQAIPKSGQPAGRKRFLQMLDGTGAPDWALESLVSLAEALPIRRALGQAWSHSELWKLLVLLGARSRATTDLLAREPLLFETLVGQPEEIFKPDWGWKFLKAHDLTKFKTYNEQKILIPFLAGQQDIVGVLEKLSAFSEELLGEFCSKLPHGREVCLVALGKLGGKEITFGSDLDLIFLYDKGMMNPAEAESAAKMIREFFKEHSIYDVDFRLRPEGKSAPLATEVDYYKDYLDGRASLWERQSLVKARILSGSPETRTRVLSIIEEFTFGRPLPEGWTGQVMGMREQIEKERSAGDPGINLKTGFGGLVDLEFALQALQLRFATDFPELRTQNSFSVLKTLQQIKIAEGMDLERLKNNLTLFRTLETFVRLNAVSGDFILPSDIVRLQALSAATGKSSGAELKQSLHDAKQENRKILTRVLTLCSS